MNLANFSITYSISQRNKDILEYIHKVYGGYLIYHDKNLNSFRWLISKKEDVINITENYFLLNQPYSKKLIRIKLISKFYELKSLKAHLAKPNSELGKKWANLIEEWKKDFKK